MVSVDNKSLIQRICIESGLEGKALESLRARLLEMNNVQLMAELSGVKGNNTVGLEVEKTNQTSPSRLPLPRQELTEEQAKDFSISTIESNIESAEKILESQDLGIVSEGYDKAKEYLNSDISSANVKEVIDNQKMGVQNLKYAKDGALSKKDYYLQNKERLKQMIMRRLYTIDSKSGDNFLDRNKGNYTKEQFAQFLENYINTTVDKMQSLDSIKGMQHSLVMADEAKEKEFLDKLLQNANNDKNKPNFQGIEGQGFEIKSDNIPVEFNSDEAISFEDVYKYERGTEYSKESIERYKQASDEMNFTTGAFNKYQQFNVLADTLLDDDSPSDERSKKLIEVFKNYYTVSGGQEELKQLIENSKLPVDLTDKGIDLSAYPTEEKRQKAIDSLIKLAKQDRVKDLERVLNNQSIEHYQSNYETSFAAAMGTDNAEELSQAMKEDNLSAIQRYAGNTAMGGMALMVVGGILTAVPVTTPLGMGLMGIGQVGAMGGMAARNILGFTDAFTRDNVSSDELKELSKDLAMDIGGFIIGGAAGKKGIQIGEKILAESGDTVAKFIAEKGTDFTISLAGDLAMMGALNSSDTTGSLTQGNLMGIVVSTVTGISSAKYKHMKGKGAGVNVETKLDSNPIRTQLDEEIVAPFAERVLNEPQIGDVVVPDRTQIKIENGDFDKSGDFVPDGTFTRTENHSFAKKKTIKPTPMGYMTVADNFKDLETQIAGSTTLSKKEIQYRISNLKYLMQDKPELSVSDVSEMIINMRVLKPESIADFIQKYDGLSGVKDFKAFKENLSTLTDAVVEMKQNPMTEQIGDKLSNIRLDYLTNNMASIKPEEFKKNLEYLKTLDSKLQDGALQRGYKILFDAHEDKYFKRLDVVKEYNKYLQDNNLSDKQMDYYTYMVGEYTDEKFDVFKNNIELAKQLNDKGLITSDFMSEIVNSNNSKYAKTHEKLITELSEEKLHPFLVEYTMRSSNYKNQDTVIEVFKHLPSDMVKTLMEHNTDRYKIFEKMYITDPNVQKDVILKAQILEKMPQLGKHHNNPEFYSIIKFLNEFDVKNPEKVLEFASLAEPKYLSKIGISGSERASYDFNKILNEGNIDLMIENAKLHQELPQSFRDYLNSNESMAANNTWNQGSQANFDYTSNPKDFQQRIETINKYKDKLSNYHLENIYNGSLKVDAKILDVLSSLSNDISKGIVSYNKADILNSADKETLDKFVKYVNGFKDIPDYDRSSFVGNISDDFMKLFKELSLDELEALPFKKTANINTFYLDIADLKSKINIVPKKIRDIIKVESISSDLYFGYLYTRDNQDYMTAIRSLDELSESDLKSIGAKPLSQFLIQSIYSNTNQLNQKKVESWRDVSQDIKDKLDGKAYVFLTSESEIDLNTINSKTKYLKDNQVFDDLSDVNYSSYLRNQSKDIDYILDTVLKDESFDKSQFNAWILSMSYIKNNCNSDFSFVKELLNNKNININEILSVTSSLSNVERVVEFQKAFARELIARDDVDNKIIDRLLWELDRTRYDEVSKTHVLDKIAKLRADFAKELLDNPNVKNEDIYLIIQSIKGENFDIQKDLVVQAINSKKIKPEEFSTLFKNIDNNFINIVPERIDFAKFLINEKSLSGDNVISILSNSIKNEAKVLSKITDMIKDLVKYETFDKSDIALIVKGIHNDADFADIQISFVKELLSEHDFPKDKIVNIVAVLNENNIDFARELSLDKDFPKEQIAGIISNTKPEILKFAKELYHNKDIPNIDIITILQSINKNIKHKDIIRDLSNNKDFPKKYLKDIAEYLSSNKNNIENIEYMTSTPELKKWLGKNLENGFNVEILYHLSRTQKKLYTEAENLKTVKKQDPIQPTEAKAAAVEVAKPQDIIKAEEALVNLGVHPKMAPNYVKMCQENGIVDKVKLDAVCALAQVGVPVKEIKNIFATAVGSPLSSANGEFRPDIIKDIVVFKQSGIEDIKLATNLSAVKNMSVPELKSRLNTKIREDLVSRLNELPDEVKQKLESSGTDLDAVIDKAMTEPKGVKGAKLKQADVQQMKLRSLDNIVGVEKVVLNKYKNEIDQSIWGDPVRFKAWAEERLNKVLDFEQNPNYTATGDYSKFNDARKQGVESWYKYLKEESNYKDDVFVQLLVMDGITKEMKPNNANTPPAVSHESFEATYNALLESGTLVSFSKIYAQQTKLKAIKQFGKEPVSIDGMDGQWVTIPRTKKGEADYDEHIAMVQALAEGSSWCLRFENAHSYLKGGNLHFFVDRNGNSQVAINETDGRITQIQKRYDQDFTVPIPYSKVIDIWAKENNYTGKENEIKTALAAKPQFDARRTKLAEYEANGDYLSIFKELNISVNTDTDGTYILSSYNPRITKQYSLFDLGVNENKLMQNVSKINYNLELNGSSVTTLPKLRIVGGNLNFGDNKVSDLRNLERINGKNIVWDR